MAKSELDQFALPLVDLGRKLAAVFGRHGPLHVLDDGRHRTSVIVELFAAIEDFDTVASAVELIRCALIRVLKSPPAADVINEDKFKIGAAVLHIVDKSAERVAPIDAEAALTRITISPYNREIVFGGEQFDSVGLIFRRIDLVVG